MNTCDFCNYETEGDDDWFTTFDAINYGPPEDRAARTLCRFCAHSVVAARHANHGTETTTIVKDVATMLNVMRAESRAASTGDPKP